MKIDRREIFSKKLGILRRQRGLTLQQLGDAIGMSVPAVSMLEKGQRSPSFELLYKIAEFFNVSFDFLLTTDTEILPVSHLAENWGEGLNHHILAIKFHSEQVSKIMKKHEKEV